MFLIKPTSHLTAYILSGSDIVVNSTEFQRVVLALVFINTGVGLFFEEEED